MTINTDKLVKADALLEALFAPKSRPSLRTLRKWQKARVIPYYKIGHAVWFDIPTVRAALERKNLVRNL